MRKSKLSLLFTILLTCVWGGVLTSCDSFLNSEKIKNEIEASIAYANADSYTIRVEYAQSSGVVKLPAGGITNKKVTDKFTVSFDPAPDLDFLRWKLIDYTTKKEIPIDQYFSFDDKYNSQTECTLLKAPEESVSLCLVPLLLERPRILAKTPVPGTETYKNTPIQVNFNRDMDPSSIYYTTDEKVSIEAKYKNTRTDVEFLPSYVNGELKYHGYKTKHKGQTEWQNYYFKNIVISSNNGGGNLLKHFGAPYFETPRLLYIPTNEDDPIPDWTQVLVDLDKSFLYKYSIEDGIDKDISLTMGEGWVYQVTSSKDETPPELYSATVQVWDSSNQIKPLTATAKTSITSSSYASTQINGARTAKVKFGIRDQESGPSQSFKLILTQFATWNGSSYKALSTPAVQEKYIDFDTVSSQVASFDGEVELTDLDLSDGVYGLSFVFTDKSGIATNYPSAADTYFPFQIKTTSTLPFPKTVLLADKTEDSVTFAWLMNTSATAYTGYDVKWSGKRSNGEKISGSQSLDKNYFCYKIENTHDVVSLIVSLRVKNNSQQQAYKSYDILKNPVNLTFLAKITGSYTNTKVITVKGLLGELKSGDQVNILGRGNTYNCSVTGLKNRYEVEMDSLLAGDDFKITFDSSSIMSELCYSTSYSNGYIICKPGEIANHKKFTAYFYLYSEQEGGLSNPINSGYRPYLRSDVGADPKGLPTVTFEGTFELGTSKIVTLEFLNSNTTYAGEPLYVGQTFNLVTTSGGRTVGKGIIMAIDN